MAISTSSPFDVLTVAEYIAKKGLTQTESEITSALDDEVADAATISSYWSDGDSFAVTDAVVFDYYITIANNKANKESVKKILTALLDGKPLFLNQFFKNYKSENGEKLTHAENTLNAKFAKWRSEQKGKVTNKMLKDAFKTFCVGHNLVVSHVKGINPFDKTTKEVLVMTID